jgi:hypothetical protein
MSYNMDPETNMRLLFLFGHSDSGFKMKAFRAYAALTQLNAGISLLHDSVFQKRRSDFQRSIKMNPTGL